MIAHISNNDFSEQDKMEGGIKGKKKKKKSVLSLDQKKTYLLPGLR